MFPSHSIARALRAFYCLDRELAINRNILASDPLRFVCAWENSQPHSRRLSARPVDAIGVPYKSPYLLPVPVLLGRS